MASLIYGTHNLGSVLDCVKNYKAQKITNIALDGTPYVQQTGVATERRNIHVFCTTKEKRDYLDMASNNGGLLIVHGWKGKDIKGYIEKDVTWREWKNESGVGKFTLIVKEVVDE